LVIKMESTSFTHDNIDLRSEKVRKFIGEIPSSLIYLGMGIITIVLVVLLVAVSLLPYPYSDGETILKHLLEKIIL